MYSKDLIFQFFGLFLFSLDFLAPPSGVWVSLLNVRLKSIKLSALGKL